jgi:TetR/AcrR family transcriptional repressor of bet genes
MSGLVALLPHAAAIDTAETIAAMIDGFYIRRALKDGPTDAVSAARLVEDYVELRLAR